MSTSMMNRKTSKDSKLDCIDEPDGDLFASGFYLPYDPDLVARAKELRKAMTQAERYLWYDYLRVVKPKFYRQRPIDHFIVDFYCPAAKLVIEIDGEPRFTPDGKNRDQERTTRLKSYGLRILRFSNDEVINSFAGVCQIIEGLLRIKNPPNPP